jgi:phosphoribosylaminoimidazolecarboxamide formyltransferase/IMP cyclohydrolase
MEQRVRRALVSVHDKEGVVELCQALTGMGVEILSSGGTARLLAEHAIPITSVADHTGSPEMLDGRVKTLHPRIHAGILAVRGNRRHMEDLERAGIATIDLVVVNLYPFERTASIAGVDPTEVVEMIDVGGPTLLRAAAKNFAHVGVVVRPGDYEAVVRELYRAGGLGEGTRLRLAVEAFRHTASYDQAIHAWLAGRGTEAESDAPAFPETLRLEFSKQQDLRYGENPHQLAALYREPLATGRTVATARQLQGKPLSFNNILDLDAAAGVAAAFAECACAIIKHGNPSGVGLGAEPLAAFRRALACDPLSAFGGVIAFNRSLDSRAAEAIVEQFYEAVIAPAFDGEARERLATKKNLRLLDLGGALARTRSGHDLRRIAGGLLVQDWDEGQDDVRAARVATARSPSEEEWRALAFAWTVATHVKSNAIVFAHPDRTIGIGAGQMSRVDSVQLAIMKAREPIAGAVMASDAFFPFRDGIDAAAAAGIRAVAQPGGSVRDDEVVAAADEHGLAMVLTERRHFRH